MNRNETEQETLDFDSASAPAISPALVGLLISAISGALVGACLTLVFVMPLILNR